MFYGFYNDFVTFPVLFQTNNMADLGTSIKELFTYKTLLLFADAIILMFLSRKFKHFVTRHRFLALRSELSLAV